MIQNFFGSSRKSVASVIAAFNETIQQLNEVEQENNIEASRHAQAILDSKAAHDAAIREAALAREVADKLTNVIAPALPAIGTQALQEDSQLATA